MPHTPEARSYSQEECIRRERACGGWSQIWDRGLTELSPSDWLVRFFPSSHLPCADARGLCWLFHISYSFPRRNPAQKIIYNSLRDTTNLFPISNPVIVIDNAMRRHAAIGYLAHRRPHLPPLDSVPSNPDFSHCKWLHIFYDHDQCSLSRDA